MDNKNTSKSRNIWRLFCLLLLLVGLETAVVLPEISDTTRLVLLGVGLLVVGLWGRKYRVSRNSQRQISESSLANSELGIESGGPDGQSVSVKGGEALPVGQKSPEPIAAVGTKRQLPPSRTGLGPSVA